MPELLALLLDLCDTVELLEGARNFVDKAKQSLAWAGERVERTNRNVHHADGHLSPD